MRPGPDQMFVDLQKKCLSPKDCAHIRICSAAKLRTWHDVAACGSAPALLRETSLLPPPLNCHLNELVCVRSHRHTHTDPCHCPRVLLCFYSRSQMWTQVTVIPTPCCMAFSHHRMALTCQVGDRTDTRRKTTAFLPARLKWCQPLTVIQGRWNAVGHESCGHEELKKRKKKQAQRNDMECIAVMTWNA
jgi:hypothetical protein